jgi:hypothetical protein
MPGHDQIPCGSETSGAHRVKFYGILTGRSGDVKLNGSTGASPHLHGTLGDEGTVSREQ